MEILFLVILIFINGVFAMSEIALVAARKSRLQRLADEGDKSAKVAVRLNEEPTQFLSTIQIGITAIGILNGIIGEAALAEPLSELLQNIGLDAQNSLIVASFVVLVSITYFTIVIGELVPKRLALHNAEGIARRMARPIALLSKLSRPFVFVLSVSTDGLLRLMGKKQPSDAELTEEDIDAVLVEGSRRGVIEKQEHEMVRKVFRLDDRQIPSLMTPRSEIVALDINQPIEQELEKVMASDHSRFPVCRAGMHEVIGVITAKRLFKQRLRNESFDINSLLSPAVYVPESLTGMTLLEQFRSSGVQMVFVVDEYGEIQGLVTIQDLLEALAGEFMPHRADDLWAVQRADGSWLLDGLIPTPELKDRLNLKTVPEEDKGRYHTLSGMLMWLMGQVPQTGDVTEWESWRFEVMDLDGNRIDKVLACRLPEKE